jgi:hypothetical protein
MLNNTQRKLFINLFSDLDYELNEMGWSIDPSGLVGDMLFNHLGIEILDADQLEKITQAIINKQKFQSAIAFYNLGK